MPVQGNVHRIKKDYYSPEVPIRWSKFWEMNEYKLQGKSKAN